MYKYLCVLFLFCISCSTTPKNEESLSSIRENISDILDHQENAWNEGDFEGFMDAYWKSDSLKFLCDGKITYSWISLMQTYKKTYSSAESRGLLKFDLLTIDKISDKHILITGKYIIKRQSSLNGDFSLIWMKIDDKWTIIFDHSS